MSARKLPNSAQAQQDENDALLVAVHEHGHAVAAAHFKVYGVSSVVKTRRTDPEDRCFRGTFTPYNPEDLTPFRKAVVCWAGPIAGHLHRDTYNMKFPDVVFSDLMDELSMAENFFGGDLSDTDREGIEAHVQITRTFRTAFRIVTTKWDTIQTLAQTTRPMSEREYRTRFGTPARKGATR